MNGTQINARLDEIAAEQRVLGTEVDALEAVPEHLRDWETIDALMDSVIALMDEQSRLVDYLRARRG